MLAKTFFTALSVLATCVAAGMYPAKGPVKMLTQKDFKKVLSEDRAVIVAFVAPWCGHCKNLTPEYISAAKALNPLVPFYAVDCDAQENKQICGEQGIKGFPTIKSFPRGLKTPPHDYRGERKSGAIIEYMTSEVPNRAAVVKGHAQVEPWLKKEPSLPHALLLTSKPKAPLLWKVVANKFNKKIGFGASKDTDGATAKALGLAEATGKESHILIWEAGATKPTVYKGGMKYDALVKHFESLLGSKSKEEL
ncbi:hypothetical protein FRC00_010504 [Tulasnella sp. 408]|nr:hypothetical protein FRC00_010504 [Tulasnella sp. 408]